MDLVRGFSPAMGGWRTTIRFQDFWTSFRFFVIAIALEIFPLDDVFGFAYNIPRRHVIQSVLILVALFVLWCAKMESIEEKILVSFYGKTTGQRWANSRNWCTEKRIGAWSGVKMTSNGRISGLRLDNNKLSGKN